MIIFNKIYYEVLDLKKENNNNNHNNLNNNSIFNKKTFSLLVKKKDYSMFLNYNNKIIKVLILIYDYYFIFENRYLDFLKIFYSVFH
jgi:hypothetical protein